MKLVCLDRDTLIDSWSLLSGLRQQIIKDLKPTKGTKCLINVGKVSIHNYVDMMFDEWSEKTKESAEHTPSKNVESIDTC